MMKKKILVYGNCQHTHIERFLAETKLTQYFEILRVKDVYCKDKTGLTEKDLQKVDLFVHQHVSKEFDPYFCSDNIKSLLKPTAQTICIPNFWFGGYHIQQAKNPIVRRNSKYSISPSGIFAYGDKFIVKALRENKSKSEIIDSLCSTDFVSTNEVMKNLEQNFAEIQRREDLFKVDIPSLKFIKENFQKDDICCSVNHPNANYFLWLTKELLKILDIDSTDVDKIKLKPFSKGFLHVPVYPAVIKALGLSFLNSNTQAKQYKFYNQMYSFEDYIDYYIEHSSMGNINGKDVVRVKTYRDILSGEASYIESDIAKANIERLNRIYNKLSLFDDSGENQIICGQVKVNCKPGMHKDVFPGLSIFFRGSGNRVYINSECKFSNSQLYFGENSYAHFSKSTWNSLFVNNRLHQGGLLFVGEGCSGSAVRINLLGDNLCFIDDFCLLETGTQIFCSDGHSILNDEEFLMNPNSDVILGKKVWCGTNSIILKGSNVGQNSIIFPGAVFSSRDGVSNAMFMGNPAKNTLNNVHWDLRNPGNLG